MDESVQSSKATSLNKNMLQVHFLSDTVLDTSSADSNKTDMLETSEKSSEERSRQVMKSL